MTQAYSNKALPPGTVLREWRLEQVLGVGGFGIVYKGRGLYFDELVAIKEYFPSAISERRDGDTVVPNDSAAEEVHALGLKKFVEEAKLLWNLSKPTRHPNIVSVRSLFEIHGTAYIVMDFEDGVSLSQLLKDGKTFTETTLRPLIQPIAEGLDRAHRVGVVHRDIKPANILVSEDGRPVLIDFGSARFDAGQATSTKVTFHTPPYAAIEQYVKTYDQGPWTDIYALGVALYECVAGEKPPEVLERLHGGLGTPLADGDWPGYSKAFLRAIDVAMIIRPNERPQSIPQWLAMFDAPEDVPIASVIEDAPTRFAAFQKLPEEIVPVPGVQPKIDEASAPVEAPEAGSPPVVPVPAEAKKPVKVKASKPKSATKLTGKLRPLPIGIAAAALLAVGGGAWIFWPQTNRSTLSAVPGLPEGDVGVISGDVLENGAVPVPTEATPGNGDFAAAIDSLAAEARRIGRLGGQVGKLNAASARLKTLAAEVATLAGQPQAAADVQARMEEMRKVAIAASAQLAGAMAGEADRQSKQLPRSLPLADPNASGAAQKAAADFRAATAQMDQAKGRIYSAAAVAKGAADPNQAIQAARQGLAVYGQFGSAYGRASRAASAARQQVAVVNLLPQRKQEFEAIDGSARAIYQRIVEMGRGGKPGLFASNDRRDGYRVRQDNAAKAKNYLSELDQLVRSMQATTTTSAAESLISQVRGVKSSLSALESSSSAAMPKKGSQPTPAAPTEGND